MKEKRKELYALFTLLAVVFFFVNALYGLFAIDRQRELHCEVEHADCRGMDGRGDLSTATIPFANEIREDEQKIDVCTNDDRNPSEGKADEQKHELGNGECGLRKQHTPDLLPMYDHVDDKTECRHPCRCERNDRTIDCHRNVLICIVCLFVMIVPTVFKNL